ncbi:MAG: general secretion pathway protein GspK [Gammaproteobacteria bacterium]|nr:general secretion pathway protein GspK [Gammaproteobacteria bacterium]
MKRGRLNSSRQQGGMALIVVLWLVVLLSIMAAGHSRNAHTDTKLASRQVDFAKARALAEAGINHIILDMLADNPAAQHPVDGTVFSIDIYGDAVTLAIRDATGLVDLNAAGPDLLGATLQACGVVEPLQRKLVDAILDWRDKDDLAHLHGIEDDDYLAAGVPWTSRDDAFESVDELKYLPGVSQALYDRLAPLVTVHSRNSNLNLEYAPPALITALTGDEVQPATSDGAEQKTRGARNGTYHIYSSAAGGSGTIASIEAVVNISRSSKYPFTVLDWREPPRAEFPPRAGAQG